MKLLRRHKLHGLSEFLQEVVPGMGAWWTKGREILGARAMQHAPRMWQGCGKRPNAHLMMQSFSLMKMQSSSIKVSHQEGGCQRQARRKYPPMDAMQVA